MSPDFLIYSNWCSAMALKWWTARSKGIYVFAMSPFEQRAMFDVKNSLQRFIKSNFRASSLIAVSLVFSGLYIASWAEKDFHRRSRKDPQAYEDEYKRNTEHLN